MAFYELRQYHVLPGKMDAWVKLMEEEIIPYQVSKGMVITALFRGATDDSAFVWMRRFESEEQRAQQYKDVYESEFWITHMAPRLGELRDRSKMVVTRLLPTPRSPTQ